MRQFCVGVDIGSGCPSVAFRVERQRERKEKR